MIWPTSTESVGMRNAECGGWRMEEDSSRKIILGTESNRISGLTEVEYGRRKSGKEQAEESRIEQTKQKRTACSSPRTRKRTFQSGAEQNST